jgi:MYXO-CTERM domain-containing protein
MVRDTHAEVHVWWVTLGWASSAGKAGHAEIGCTCHGAAPAGALVVSFGPVPTRVPPGKLLDVTLEVLTTVPEWFDGGLDVAADLGALGAGANTKLLSGDITHPGAPGRFVAGEIVWEFTWEAPHYDGVATLHAVANGVDGGGTTAGDGYAFAAPVLIAIDSTCVDLDGDGADICTGDCDDDDGTTFPGAPELADGLDNDCDDVVDEDVATTAPGSDTGAELPGLDFEPGVTRGTDDPAEPTVAEDRPEAPPRARGCEGASAPPSWLAALGVLAGARTRRRSHIRVTSADAAR